ncbi:hypothetical protein [Scytonema sp. NUACC26]|uniref:hypothetical protein n=1 Tax=Scytonema sp. NUACC26 TaxID=3140176 RepID=UPI0034DCC033
MSIDGIGNWEILGTITPNDNWQLLNSSIVDSGEVVLRFSFSVDWFEWKDYVGNRSYGLLRFYYPTAEQSVSRGFKLYLTEEKLIRTYNDIDTTAVKDIGIKRVHYPKFKGYYSAIPLNWTVTVEHLLS